MIVVTGARGFIGSELLARLVKEGIAAVGVDAAPASSIADPAEVVELDVHDTHRLAELAEGADLVVHLAASSTIRDGHLDTRRDLDNGLIACHSCLEAARLAGTRHFCLASSSAVYGPTDAVPIRESHPLRPISLFGAAKAAAEAYVSAYSSLYGFGATILRFGNVLGPRLHRGIVFDFVRKLVGDPTRLEILGDGRQRKSYVDVDDCVAATIQLARPERATLEVYNVATGSSLSAYDVAREVIAAVGLDDVEVMAGGQEAWRGDVPVIELAVDCALEAGWAPTRSAEETVRRSARALAEEIAPGLAAA